jgi:hypothetical protein
LLDRIWKKGAEEIEGEKGGRRRRSERGEGGEGEKVYFVSS